MTIQKCESLEITSTYLFVIQEDESYRCTRRIVVVVVASTLQFPSYDVHQRRRFTVGSRPQVKSHVIRRVPRQIDELPRHALIYGIDVDTDHAERWRY